MLNESQIKKIFTQLICIWMLNRIRLCRWWQKNVTFLYPSSFTIRNLKQFSGYMKICLVSKAAYTIFVPHPSFWTLWRHLYQMPIWIKEVSNRINVKCNAFWSDLSNIFFLFLMLTWMVNVPTQKKHNCFINTVHRSRYSFQLKREECQHWDVFKYYLTHYMVNVMDMCGKSNE